MKYTVVKKSDIQELEIAIDQLKKEIEEATDFIKGIEDGKLDIKFSADSISRENELAKALVSMRNKMTQLAEEERQRNWVTEGLAKFVDILRADNDDIQKLSDNILRNLVKYLKANQGWLFVVNNNDPNNHFLELNACYAYERKKFVEKQIGIGEGLVGQAYLEKETIYMIDIPREYSHITSGLGEAVPGAILIVPLKVNDEIFGVIELGTFQKIPDYQIKFVEKLGESIASTIANTKVNERTKILLQQTQEQTEQLRSQEEEMRQNMEELHATQEEMQRKATEIENRIDAYNRSGIASIEFDLKGNISNANEAFLQLMGYELSQILGKHHRIFVDPSYATTKEYDQFWNNLAKGETFSGEFKRYTSTGREVYLNACYTFIKDASGKPVKVIKLGTDVTENRELHKRITLLEKGKNT